MKSVSKPSSARLRRPAPANGAITSNRRHNARIASEVALADVMDDHWDASEKEFDLADLDYDSIDDSDVWNVCYARCSSSSHYPSISVR